MRSLDRHTFTDLTQMGCSGIFEFFGLDIVNAGCGWCWSRGRGGSGIWIGGGVRGGDNSRHPSELLHRAALSISPMACCQFAGKEAVKAFWGA
jgi:hypothetical protein